MYQFALSTAKHLNTIFPPEIELETIVKKSLVPNIRQTPYDAKVVKRTFDQMCHVAKQPLALVDNNWGYGNKPSLEAASFLVALVMSIHGCSIEQAKTDPNCFLEISLLLGQMLAGLGGANLIQSGQAHLAMRDFFRKMQG